MRQFHVRSGGMFLLFLAFGCGSDGFIDGDNNSDPGASDSNPQFQFPFSKDAGVSPTACKKVDLVISVDDSGSMREEKLALRNTVFPAFATALREVGGGLEDYRVGVLDACPSPANFHTTGLDEEDEPVACDFEGGNRWMSSASSKLEQEFQCVGHIDSGDKLCSGKNDDEQPASAAATILEASQAHMNNQGFLRDDALLVVIAITDEDETPDPGANPEDVYRRLVTTKGDVRQMVFLGIAGGSDCEGAYGDAEDAKFMKELTSRFADADRGVFWDLCAGRLEDGLVEAMEVIETACGELPEVVLL